MRRGVIRQGGGAWTTGGSPLISEVVGVVIVRSPSPARRRGPGSAQRVGVRLVGSDGGVVVVTVVILSTGGSVSSVYCALCGRVVRVQVAGVVGAHVAAARLVSVRVPAGHVAARVHVVTGVRGHVSRARLRAGQVVTVATTTGKVVFV